MFECEWISSKRLRLIVSSHETFFVERSIVKIKVLLILKEFNWLYSVIQSNI